MASDLGDRRREDGAKLVTALTDAGVEIYAAFWAFRTTVEEWRLIIVTPDVESKGPRSVLRTVDSELTKVNGRASFDLFDIEVSGPQNPEVTRLVRSLGILGMTHVVIKDLQIDDEYLEGLHVYTMKIDRIFDN